MQMPRQRKIFLSRSIWLLGRLHRQLVWLFWSCLWVCHMFWHLTDCLGCLLGLDIFFLWLTFDSELSLYLCLPVSSNFSWSWACLYRNSSCLSCLWLTGAPSLLPKVLAASAASFGFGSDFEHSLGRKLIQGGEFSCIQIGGQKHGDAVPALGCIFVCFLKNTYMYLYKIILLGEGLS